MRVEIEQCTRLLASSGDLLLEPGLAELLADAVARGIAAYPDLGVGEEELGRALCARVARAQNRVPAAVLLDLRAGDVCLALGCSLGRPAALATFTELFGGEFSRVLSRTRNQSLDAEELKSAAMERLFVGPSPKIDEYAGTGDLRSWLRTVLIRLSLDLSRKRRELPTESPDLDAAMPAVDPEIEYLKGLYRGAFKAAFEEAARSLDPEERNLLRLHCAHGRTVDELAPLFHLHRATVASPDRQSPRRAGARHPSGADEEPRARSRRLRLGPADDRERRERQPEPRPQALSRRETLLPTFLALRPRKTEHRPPFRRHLPGKSGSARFRTPSARLRNPSARSERLSARFESPSALSEAYSARFQTPSAPRENPLRPIFRTGRGHESVRQGL